MFVEQPSAISAAMALRSAAAVMIAEGRISSWRSFMICIPEALARRIRAAATAGTVPFPGRAMPMTSVMQFIELAVNIPAQEPQPGQIDASISISSSSVIFPALTAPIPSKISLKEARRPWKRPANMGPPLITIAGRSSRAAAMSIPGTILSQFGINTRASKAWARAIISMESAMSSRLASEYFIPS